MVRALVPHRANHTLDIGERGADRTSRMPISRTWFWKSLPKIISGHEVCNAGFAQRERPIVIAVLSTPRSCERRTLSRVMAAWQVEKPGQRAPKGGHPLCIRQLPSSTQRLIELNDYQAAVNFGLANSKLR